MAVDSNARLTSNGPFRGINYQLTPNKLGESDQLFCIEMFNLVVDPLTGELRSRNGFQNEATSASAILGISQYENINYQNYSKQQELVVVTVAGLDVYIYNAGTLEIRTQFTFPIDSDKNISFSEINNILYIQIEGEPLKRYDGDTFIDAGVIPGAVLAENHLLVRPTTVALPAFASNGVEITSNNITTGEQIHPYPASLGCYSVPTHKASGSATTIPDRSGWYFKRPLDIIDNWTSGDNFREDFALAWQSINKDGSIILGDASAKSGKMDRYNVIGTSSPNYSIKKTSPEYASSLLLGGGSGIDWGHEIISFQTGAASYIESYLNTFKNKQPLTYKMYPSNPNYIQLTELFWDGVVSEPTARVVNSTLPIGAGLSDVELNEFVYFQAILYVDFYRTGSTGPTVAAATYTYPYKVLIRASKKTSTEFNENIRYMFLPCANIAYTGEWIDCTWSTMLNSNVVSTGFNNVPTGFTGSQYWQYGLMLDISSLTKDALATKGSFVKVYTRKVFKDTSISFQNFDNLSLPFTELETMYLTDIIPANLGYFYTGQNILDPYYLISQDLMGPSTLIDNQQYLPDSLRYVYNQWASKFNYDFSQLTPDLTTLPISNHLSTFQQRLWMTNIKSAPNTAFASDSVYGVDMSDGSLSSSLKVNNSIPGDYIVGSVNLGDSLALICKSSVHLVQGDFASNNIRVDEIISGGYGCVNSQTIRRVRDGAVYLSSAGPVYLKSGAYPQFLGGGEDSRVGKLFAKAADLDFSRAYAYYDENDNSYNLHVKSNVGFLLDLTLRYDFLNDSFSTTDISFIGAGLIDNKKIWASPTFLRSFKNDGDLSDFTDLTNIIIPFRYLSHFITFGDASILKQIKFFRLISTNTWGQSNNFNYFIKIFRNYDNQLSLNPVSSGPLKFAWNYLMGVLKLRTTKFYTIQYEITREETDSTDPTTPSIQSIEIEAVPIYKNQIKPW